MILRKIICTLTMQRGMSTFRIRRSHPGHRQPPVKGREKDVERERSDRGSRGRREAGKDASTVRSLRRPRGSSKHNRGTKSTLVEEVGGKMMGRRDEKSRDPERPPNAGKTGNIKKPFRLQPLGLRDCAPGCDPEDSRVVRLAIAVALVSPAQLWQPQQRPARVPWPW